MKVIGIDPSTKSGICIIDTHTQHVTTYVVQFEDTKGMKRLQLIADEFEEVLNSHPDIEVAVIEGYGYSNKFTLVLMTEIGILLRMALHKRGIPIYTAPPTLVKKYVTGVGTSKKPAMAKAVKLRWGFDSPSDDVVDAYVIARIAESIALKGVTANIKGVARLT